MILTTKQLFDHSYQKYALGAYNINNMEQIQGLFQGCVDSKAPFILQISRGAIKYAGAGMLSHMITAAEERSPEAIFAVHLDHGTEESCYECIDSGAFSSVMIDASHFEFDENVAITKRVVDRAHDAGISVEAELGMLGGVEEDIAVDEDHAMLTDPDQAVEFVEKTGVDCLAVAIGTSHGAYKFSGGQGLHFDRLKAINEKLPGTPLVMHGSSSVPPSEVERINAAGGTMDPSAQGVKEADITKAVPFGVCKVNIDTDGRLVWTRVHREFFRDKPDGFDLRKPGTTFVEEYAKFVAAKNGILLSAGHLDNLRESVG